MRSLAWYQDQLYVGTACYRALDRCLYAYTPDEDLWTHVFPGTNGAVYAMAVYNGWLHVAGHFGYIGDYSNPVKASGIARFDGTAWATLDDAGAGTGMDWNINVLVVDSDGGLVIGGEFQRIDVAWVNRVAELNTGAPPGSPTAYADVNAGRLSTLGVGELDMFNALAWYDGTVLGGGSSVIAVSTGSWRGTRSRRGCGTPW